MGNAFQPGIQSTGSAKARYENPCCARSAVCKARDSNLLGLREAQAGGAVLGHCLTQHTCRTNRRFCTTCLGRSLRLPWRIHTGEEEKGLRGCKGLKPALLTRGWLGNEMFLCQRKRRKHTRVGSECAPPPLTGLAATRPVDDGVAGVPWQDPCSMQPAGSLTTLVGAADVTLPQLRVLASGTGTPSNTLFGTPDPVLCFRRTLPRSVFLSGRTDRMVRLRR